MTPSGVDDDQKTLVFPGLTCFVYAIFCDRQQFTDTMLSEFHKLFLNHKVHLVRPQLLQYCQKSNIEYVLIKNEKLKITKFMHQRYIDKLDI